MTDINCHLKEVFKDGNSFFSDCEILNIKGIDEESMIKAAVGRCSSE